MLNPTSYKYAKLENSRSSNAFPNLYKPINSDWLEGILIPLADLAELSTYL